MSNKTPDSPSSTLLPGIPVSQRTPPLSIAPMMDRTDRHFRFFFRQLSTRALLYTEMVTTGAVLHGDRDSLLGFSPREKPLALQLGGDNPTELAACAEIARDWGYDEVNLNVGCPSDRVQKGRFGACLMAEPERVRELVEAMRAQVDLPITVKHRIGIDDLDRYEDMARFVGTVASSGCWRFSVHARKAWLQGVSPKENRTIPPLRYDEVYQLKREFPHLDIEINGGIRTLEQARGHLEQVDAVMVGRGSYEDPYAWAAADQEIFQESTLPPSRGEVVAAMLPYIEAGCSQGLPLGRMARHLLGLFASQPGARAWKRHLSENVHLTGAGPEVVEAALAKVPKEVQEARPSTRKGATSLSA